MSINDYDKSSVIYFLLGMCVGVCVAFLLCFMFIKEPRIPVHSGEEEVSIERLNRNLAPEYKARLVIEKVEEKK